MVVAETFSFLSAALLENIKYWTSFFRYNEEGKSFEDSYMELKFDSIDNNVREPWKRIETLQTRALLKSVHILKKKF